MQRRGGVSQRRCESSEGEEGGDERTEELKCTRRGMKRRRGEFQGWLGLMERKKMIKVSS